jgi:hypothetical protein
MVEFIVNPRRAPRAPARCHAAVVARRRSFDAETEDIGARGCQVVSPSLMKQGDPIEIVITSERLSQPLRATGTVAWVSEQPPWRVGVAFQDAYVPSAERWFEKLVAMTPGIGPFRRVPERIPLDAMVYLGTPPRYLLDFTEEEASLLRAIASGVRVDELKARLRDRWPEAQRALFSLLARQAVTLSRGHSAHPEAWKRILTEVEASLAVASLGKAPALTPPPMAPEPVPTPAPVSPLATPPPAARPRVNPAASPWAPAPTPPPVLELEDVVTPAEARPAPPPRGAARADPGPGWHPPAASASGAGVGWKHPAHQRGAEAQALYERALVEMSGGNTSRAIALLRQALTQAPGDAEIAEALGKLAFGGRPPGTR